MPHHHLSPIREPKQQSFLKRNKNFPLPVNLIVAVFSAVLTWLLTRQVSKASGSIS